MFIYYSQQYFILDARRTFDISQKTKLLINDSDNKIFVCVRQQFRLGTIRYIELSIENENSSLVKRHLRNKQNVSSDFALKSFEHLRSFVLMCQLSHKCLPTFLSSTLFSNLAISGLVSFRVMSKSFRKGQKVHSNSLEQTVCVLNEIGNEKH